MSCPTDTYLARTIGGTVTQVTDRPDPEATPQPPDGSHLPAAEDTDRPGQASTPVAEPPSDPIDPQGRTPALGAAPCLAGPAVLAQGSPPPGCRGWVRRGSSGTLIAAGLAKRVGLDIPWAAWIGLFLANWIGNGGILVPIPGLRLVGMTMTAHQGAEGATIFVGLVAGFAMALGQTSFYLTAASGSKHLEDSKDKKEKKAREGRIPDALRKAKDLTADFVDRHGFPTIFTLSTFPNPLTTFATITAGSMGMGFREFLVANFAGHVILGLILALFGQWLLGV